MQTIVISYSQKKIFDLENALSELDKDKQRLTGSLAKLEQQITNLKNEGKTSQDHYAKELQIKNSEIEKLHAQLLQRAKTAALLMDAGKREISLKRSLEAFEQERNSYKRESTLLGTDLKNVRESLDGRAKDLIVTQQDLVSARQRVSELESVRKEVTQRAREAREHRISEGWADREARRSTVSGMQSYLWGGIIVRGHHDFMYPSIYFFWYSSRRSARILGGDVLSEENAFL